MGRTPACAVALGLFVAACASSPRSGAPVLPKPCPPFPTDLDAATTWFREDGASVVLVHVRQTHIPAELWPRPTPAESGPVPPELWPAPTEAAERRVELIDRVRAANESQRAVHRVLSRLADDGWRRVFVEGEPTDALVDDVTAADEYTSALRGIEGLLDEADPSILLRFGEYGSDAAPDDPLWDALRYAPGADLLLALAGRIVLVPSERPELLDAATLALFTDGVAAADAFSDAREDAMLASVAGSREPGAVLLLGASHDLSDNVRRWNSAHPERRVALVVVTPRVEMAP